MFITIIIVSFIKQDDSFLRKFDGGKISKKEVFINLPIPELKKFSEFYGTRKYKLDDKYILKLTCINGKNVSEAFIIKSKSKILAFKIAEWGYYKNNNTIRKGELNHSYNQDRTCVYLISQIFKPIDLDSLGEKIEKFHMKDLRIDTLKYCF